MSINSTEQKTLLGYHDKHLNKLGIIDPKALPLFIEERYAPFLITRDYMFNISTDKITKVARNVKALKNFNILKRIIANIIIIPGLIVAVIYLLQTLGLLGDFSNTNPYIARNIMNFSFWPSVLGVIVLWHDYYRTKSHPTKLPKAEPISIKEIEDIKITGFKLGRYSPLESLYFFSEEALELLAKNILKERFDSFKLFQEIISDPFSKEVLNRADLDISKDKFKNLKISEDTLPSYDLPALRNILIYANEAAILTNAQQIEICHLLIALFKAYPVFQQILKENKNNTEILTEATKFLLQEEYTQNHSSIFDTTRIYYKNGGIARDLIYGWTFILGHFSSDVNEKIAKTQEVFGIGHKKEIESLTSTVGKLSKNNALLLGEPGVGKSSIIKGLAQKINRGDVPRQLKDKRIIQLDLNSLMARASREKNLEELIEKAMNELTKAGNTILYIDEIQELIPAKAEKSGHSIAGIMLPYILESNFPIVGTINYADYKRYFYSNQSLKNAFDNIEIEELSPETTLEILTAKVPFLEKNFQTYLPIPPLMIATELAQRYIHNRKLPDSAVNIVESTCSWAQTNNIKRITTEHIAKVVSIQYGIPVQSIDAEEATKLMKLEETIKQRVIGQEKAVHSIVETLKRSRTDVRDPNKPIGAFLFLGPTGVGKTYLSRVVAQEYFDRGEDIIRVDMSEYQKVSSISSFLGSNTEDLLSQHKLTLIDRIKSNPYSVVLFDEIEKAHPNILNLFLQLLDEGRLTSSLGETVSFRNSIIICTSNIGSRIILESLQKDQAIWEEAKDKAIIELRQAISPELYNRFDEIIVFSPHNINNLAVISELQLQELAKRLNNKGIILNWDSTIPMLIANKAHEPGLGARPIKRYIQRNIEGKIASEIISHGTKSGETITLKESWIT